MKVVLIPEDDLGKELLIKLHEEGDADEKLLRSLLKSPNFAAVEHKMGRVSFVLLEIPLEQPEKPEESTSPQT